jgi:nicotinamidase-related amidase
MRFLFSTAQYEMLLALEDEGSPARVAERVRRDLSVVSRALAAMVRVAPVVEKTGGRWALTALGREVNQLTRAFLKAQRQLVEQQSRLRLAPLALPARDSRSALVLLGTQVGFLSPAWGPPSDAEVPVRIGELLAAWRKRRAPVIFGRHLSSEKGSPLYRGTRGCEFIPALAPRKDERIVSKSHNSAFAGTQLETMLREAGVQNLVIAGFTTNHCVDSTARSAFDRGFHVFVVSDAVAAFDRVGPDGERYPSAVLHAATLATLHQEYATVVDTRALLDSFTGSRNVERPGAVRRPGRRPAWEGS